MLEPTLALQTAVRAALIASPAVLTLVPADQIRAGSTRPGHMPCVILSGDQVEYLGQASGSQHLARVFLDLHIWAVEDGADTAKAIGMAALQALMDAPACDGFEIDAYAKPGILWLRDPQPERSYTHGVLSLEAVLRWRF